MKLIVRKLNRGKKWVAAQLEGVAMPIAAVSEFIPRAIDDGELSCYVVSSDQIADVLHVASAMSLASLETTSHHYVGVSLESLEAAGIVVTPSDGGTFHLDADPAHVTLGVHTAQDLQKVCELYWKAVPIEIRAKDINSRRTADARNDRINFLAAIMQKERLPHHEAHFMSYAKSKDIVARGADLAD